ncbi:hypothetical protein FPQ18DRAFT_300454 [Pyronema domesticum]|nr:hypothetical protein FPQ18DRAFT_300454 [Pyronema domesticum]
MGTFGFVPYIWTLGLGSGQNSKLTNQLVSTVHTPTVTREIPYRSPAITLQEALGHETDVQVLEAGIIGSYVSESVSEIGSGNYCSIDRRNGVQVTNAVNVTLSILRELSSVLLLK